MMRTILAAVLLVATLAPGVPAEAGTSARTLYTRTLTRERALRDARNAPTLVQLRAVVSAYERLVERFPASAYSDNALWQGGNVALLAYDRFGQAADKRTAERLFDRLRTGYPSSSLVPRIEEALAETGSRVASIRPPSRSPANVQSSAEASVVGPTVRSGAEGQVVGPTFRSGAEGQVVAPTFRSGAERKPGNSTSRPGASDAVVDTPPARERALEKSAQDTQISRKTSVSDFVTIRDIKRVPLEDAVRVTIEMDGESLYHQERVENPQRVFFDLKGTRAVPALQDATLKFPDDVVREIRLGRHPKNTTRIVMDMQGVENYSVFTLYNPFRLVIDFRRATSAAAIPLVPVDPETAPVSAVILPGHLTPSAAAAIPRTAAEPAAMPFKADPVKAKPEEQHAKSEDVRLKPDTPTTVAAGTAGVTQPTVPAANSNGQFSLSRQLGLGVSRVVIDAGHGGHDPGAQANGVTEAELVLDVALRLRKLLDKQTGIEVAMTRDTDVFIPLEERTAIANRAGADLFLSIHANASRNSRARGVETYFLNFSTNPEAEAVAARENSASGRTMHSLPDIVKAIALNNKIDESRDFAGTVQRAMIKRLSARNKQLRDLGVKQAPFVVLIGAGMPSVLAEISFVTNRQEGQLLRTGAYRQSIAEALLDAVVRYQHSLKTMTAVAATRETR